MVTGDTIARARALHEAGDRTWRVGETNGQRWIECRICGLTSLHPEDLAQLYCVRCHVFHDLLLQFLAASEERALSGAP